ncbi:MAG: hypothetical protein GYB31_08395 [Bacteroidetes bacterium]|nr:hypothetical protein [Bacteroidota bacterium]
MYRLLALSLLALSSFQCGNAGGNDCTYGEPLAIFGPEMQGVVEHQFQAEGQDGLETVKLNTGLDLELYQSGCDAITQEFRFNLKDIPDSPPEPFWVSLAVSYFIQLSNLEADPITFGQYAQVIQEVGGQVVLGQQLEVGTGFYMTIDGIETNGDGVLRVIFNSSAE